MIGAILCRRGFQLGGAPGFRMTQIGAAKCLTTSPTWSSALKEEDFFEKNKRLNRPLSPHLTIYQPQVTSMLSITHRGTGLALSGLTSMFAIGMLAAPSPFQAYLTSLQSAQFGSALIFGAKFILAFPFFFHSLNGVRHLAWDLGKGFELKTLYQTGYGVLISSIIASFVAAAL